MKHHRSFRLRHLLLCTLAGVFSLSALHAANGAELSWQRGPSTREALAGTVLENDLVYVKGNGQSNAGYYPQAAVVQWGPISPERSGRYRVHLRARTEKLGISPSVLQAWVPKESGGAFEVTARGVIYRYDAAPLPTKYFPTVKAALTKLRPPVGIGNNLGICCLGNQPSADWTTYCRDGSLMMEENIANAFHSPTDPHRRWADWIAYLRRVFDCEER